MAVYKNYGDPFGANVTFSYKGRGGRLQLSLWTTWDADGSSGPSIPTKVYTLPDSIDAFRNFSTGTLTDANAFKGVWNGSTSTDQGLSMRLLIRNVDIPGAPTILYDQVTPGAFVSKAPPAPPPPTTPPPIDIEDLRPLVADVAPVRVVSVYGGGDLNYPPGSQWASVDIGGIGYGGSWGGWDTNVNYSSTVAYMKNLILSNPPDSQLAVLIGQLAIMRRLRLPGT